MRKLREDYKAYDLTIAKTIKSIILFDTFCLVSMYRLSNFLHNKHFRLLPKLIHRLDIILFSADISPSADIGGGLRIAHPLGIVIGYDAVIGKNAQIFQNVSIGSSDHVKNNRVMPTIGDNVSIFTGAVVIGAIQIGDNVSIGANAVVTKDVPANVIIAGVPAKIIGQVDVAHSLKK